MSTGKTKKLELSQWVLTDPFRMEEMNENFRKIDDAIAERPVVKLIDTTLTEATDSVVMRFNNISFVGMMEVVVYFPAREIAGFSVNDGTGNVYEQKSNGVWQSVGKSGVAKNGKLNIKGTNTLNNLGGTLYLMSTSNYYYTLGSMDTLWKLTLTSSSGFRSGDRFVALGVRA